MSRRIFNPRMLDYLNKHGEEHIIKEWVNIVKDKFNEDFTLKEMQHYFVRHHIPVKYEYPNKRNHALAHPIGSERVKSDGMVQIKVAPHKWEYKQRYIYEKYYGVDLRPDQFVIFLDQDRNNFDINNLRVVTRYEAAMMKGLELFSHNKQVTETGLLVAKLRIKEKDISKDYEKSREKGVKQGA